MKQKLPDLYKYWSIKNKERRFVWHREKVVISIISKLIKPKFKILDVGCGDGTFMKYLLEKVKSHKIDFIGIDYSKYELRKARQRGLNVFYGNVEKNLKFKNNSFNIVYCGEVIEHVYNVDHFLFEINRITKEDGFLILTTPNLCAWFNRILMLFGIQPLFLEYSMKSKMIGAGFLKKFKKEEHPVGHVRIFTLNAIKDLLKMYGFQILDVKGSIFDSGLPKPVLFFDKIFKYFPSLSSSLVIVCKKIKNIDS